MEHMEELCIYKWYPYGREVTFKYRHDPVPGTGVKRWGHYFRRMRTSNERKQNYGHRKEGIRIRGNRINLPDSWDDYPRDHQRSWKKHRRTQWKEAA